MNKKSILNTSLLLVATATVLGLSSMYLVSDPETALKLWATAGVFGLGSIGSFFVGLAFPTT